MTTTIQISREMREMVKFMADMSERSMQSVLEEAIAALWDRYLLEATNTVYAELRADRDAWRLLLQERAEWDVTLEDY